MTGNTVGAARQRVMTRRTADATYVSTDDERSVTDDERCVDDSERRACSSGETAFVVGRGRSADASSRSVRWK